MRTFYEDLRRPAPTPEAPAPAPLPQYGGETLLQRAKRALGGQDTRPPASWPFPTWKGQAVVQLDEGGPPMPARRGPKTAHNAPTRHNTDTPHHGRP